MDQLISSSRKMLILPSCVGLVERWEDVLSCLNISIQFSHLGKIDEYDCTCQARDITQPQQIETIMHRDMLNPDT